MLSRGCGRDIEIMHYVFYATFNKDDAEASEEARSNVADYLNENGFIGEGRWSSGIADWFVIGGRWSGKLTRMLLEKEKLERVEQEFEEKHGWWTGGKEHVTDEQRREQMKEMFDSEFPDFDGEFPYWRNQYELMGYDDDAMILTQELYDALLKEYEGEDDGEHHADLDYDTISPDMIEKKWIVVVDYHN
jgi:hypothetical protein